MNSIDFTQAGGYPFDEGTLDFMQACINMAANLALLAPDRSILSGCTVVGGNVTNGIVVIAGEILPFVGGIPTPKVIIVETDTALTFGDATIKNVVKERYVTFGDDGIQNLPWDTFNPYFALTKGNTTAFTPTLDYEPATKKYVDTSQSGRLASGTTNIGDADTNHSNVGYGTSVTIPIGQVLADTNYILLFSIISSAANPQQDLYHSVAIRSKAVDSFVLYFREADVNVSQNIAIDWIIFKK